MIVFITGISSGFGLETARQLSQEGHTVYGALRREVDSLPNVHYLNVDVRDREAVTEAVNQVMAQEGRIDVLVNNAGMGIGGPLEFATEEEIRQQMDTNFINPQKEKPKKRLCRRLVRATAFRLLEKNPSFKVVRPHFRKLL
ncbi:MAG: SDR family NAD(P)-dependent oxidoreductase [Bacteroidales bacterium]|nr:SDR family NAD(P)-dependent oxidoreductase [Bacteroidales bacterium]